MDDSAKLREINQRNREFWARQSPLLPQRMSDPALREIMMLMQYDEQIRLPKYYRKSLDAHGNDAERFLSICKKSQARKAGSRPKTDSLQQLIKSIVRKHRKITVSALLVKLEEHASVPGAVIEEIAEGKIHFRCRSGGRDSSNWAPISGLKDRLRRAKEFLGAR